MIYQIFQFFRVLLEVLLEFDFKAQSILWLYFNFDICKIIAQFGIDLGI